MAELSFTEKNKSLAAVLRAGKEIYQQEKQNLFVPEVEVAVTTSSSLTDGLVSCLNARHLDTQEHVRERSLITGGGGPVNLQIQSSKNFVPSQI